MRKLAFIVALAFLAPGLSGPSLAAGTSYIPRAFANHLRPGMTLDAYLSAVSAHFEAENAKAESRWLREYPAQREEFLKTERDRDLARYLPYDRDRDGRITAAEVAASLRETMEANRAPIREPYFGRVVDEIMRADLDGDGVITREEIHKIADQTLFEVGTNASVYFELLPEVGVLDAEGLREMARQTFAKLDVDGDGVISENETPGRTK